MSNINGKAYAMNVVTPMRPWKSWILKFLFFLLAHVPGALDDLANLSFIHFARWALVRRKELPFLGGPQRSEALEYDYLFFFSNFNGTWNQYIDAFSAVLNKELNLIWRWSEGAPPSLPVTPFKNYIVKMQYDTDYYFNAYPQATINDVKAAHIVHDAAEALATKVTGLSAEEFRTVYLEFVITVQAHLGDVGEPPVVF